MNDRTKKFHDDATSAINLIEEFCVDTPDFSRYSRDAKTKSAVERQLAIIGEAIGKVRKEDGDILLSSADKIVAFRNRIVHSYDSIDDSIVWAIIKLHLPQLKADVQNLLGKK